MMKKKNVSINLDGGIEIVRERVLHLIFAVVVSRLTFSAVVKCQSSRVKFKLCTRFSVSVDSIGKFVASVVAVVVPSVNNTKTFTNN